MAKLEAGRKTGKYIIKSLTPDICKTPPNGAPVPFNITMKLDIAIQYSTNVNFKKDPAAMVSLRGAPVKGDEPGTLGGLVSGVNKGWCRPLSFVPTVKVNKLNVLYHKDTLFAMNCAGPEGVGNTFGRLYCTDDMATGPAADPSKPMAGDPPITLTESELSKLGGGSSLLAKIANTPGLGVDLAKMAYGVAQNGFSPEAIVGGLGSIAGIAGMGGVAKMANLGLQAKTLAQTDWNNPAAALGALGGLSGMSGALSRSPQMAQLGKGLSMLGMGAGAAQSLSSKPGAMVGMNTVTAARMKAQQDPQFASELQDAAKTSAQYKQKAAQARHAKQADHHSGAAPLATQFRSLMAEPGDTTT